MSFSANSSHWPRLGQPYVTNALGLLSLVLLSSSLTAQEKITANATRPSAADNAYLTAPGYTELEIGGSVMEAFWSIPTFIKFSVHKRIELGFIMSGLINRTSLDDNSDTEVGDVAFQSKVQFTNQDWGAVAMVGRIDFPSGVDPKYTLYSVLTGQARAFQLDVTVGGALFDSGGGDYKTSLQYAIAAAPKLAGDLGGFVEVFGETAPGFSPVAVAFGVSLGRFPRFVPDASLTLGLNHDAPDWQVQFGFTAVLVKLLK